MFLEEKTKLREQRSGRTPIVSALMRSGESTGINELPSRSSNIEPPSERPGTENSTETPGKPDSRWPAPVENFAETPNSKLPTPSESAPKSDANQDTTGPSILDVRKEIWHVQQRMKKGEIDPKEAKEQLKTLSMVLQTVRLELQAMRTLMR